MDDRRARILQDLQREGQVLSRDLSLRYGVSEDAIRRDLRDLASLGLLQRVYGGALPRSNALESYAVRQAQGRPAKVNVARAVAAWVRRGQVLFLDGGSTLTEMVPYLPGEMNLTVITNNLPAAVALAARPDIRSVMLGGAIDPVSQITSGPQTLEELSAVRADVCLLGVCGLHPEYGLTAAHHGEAALKRAMIRQSAECAVVLTADKLGTSVPYRVAAAHEIGTLFVEAGLDPHRLAPYRSLGIQIVQSGEHGSS